MIVIVLDPYGQHETSLEKFILAHEGNYAQARMFLATGLESKAEKRLIIQHKALMRYFDSDIQQYDLTVIKEFPLEALKQKFKISCLPALVLNFFSIEAKFETYLVTSGLYKQLATGTHAHDLSYCLKSLLLGEVFSKDKLDLVDLKEIFIQLINLTNKDYDAYQSYLIGEQLKVWAKGAYSPDLFTWLMVNPSVRALYFICYQNIAHFPESKLAIWLQTDNIYNIINELPVKNLGVILPNFNLPNYLKYHIKNFLDPTWDNDKLKVFEFITGLFDYEKEFLLEKLTWYSTQDIFLPKELAQCFISCTTFPEVVQVASNLIEPELPGDLPDSASIARVQEWIKNEYLPFYSAYAIRNSLEITEPYVALFEQWLKNNYLSLMLSGSGMAYTQLSQLITSNSYPILIYIFDGLDYTTALETLLPGMNEKGFFLHSNSLPYLSLLPSETPITKPSLLAGRLPDQILGNQTISYGELLAINLASHAKEIVSAFNTEQELLDLFTTQAKIYLYLDNLLDSDFLHKSYKEQQRRTSYAEHVKKQIDKIYQVTEAYRNKYDQNLTVYISSDHGYTLIPKTTKSIPGHYDAKPRSALMDNVDSSTQKTWHLKGLNYHLNSDYLIPSGYFYFNSIPKGATHGGATPQEMAVPSFLFKLERPVMASFTQLIIYLEGDIYRKSAKNLLHLTIINDNNSQVIVSQLAAQNLRLESQLPVIIPANSSVEINCTFNASECTQDKINIKLVTTNKYYDQTYNYTTESTLTTKGAMIGDFDDEFEF